MKFFDRGLKRKYLEDFEKKVEAGSIQVECIPFAKVINSLRGIVVIDCDKPASPNYAASLTALGHFTIAADEQIWNGIPRAGEALDKVIKEKIYGHLFDLPIETGIGAISVGVDSGQRWAKEVNPRIVFKFKVTEWHQNIEWIVRLLRKLSQDLPKEVMPE